MWELLTLPLKIIFKVALNDGVFPDDWKKGNIVPAHKKDIKTMLTNYHSIGFLPILAKIFEITIFMSIFEYFIENKLFKVFQSGFLPDGSCTSQLLSIINI